MAAFTAASFNYVPKHFIVRVHIYMWQVCLRVGICWGVFFQWQRRGLAFVACCHHEKHASCFPPVVNIQGAHRCRIYWILCQRAHGQVGRVDFQGRRQVLGGWQGGWRSIGGPTFLPPYCGRWASLQSDWWLFDWSHSQEAEGGRNLCSWWNRFYLHLLRARRTTFRKLDRKFLEERLASRHAFPGLGRGAFATLVDNWLHQRLASRNKGRGREVDCGRV